MSPPGVSPFLMAMADQFASISSDSSGFVKMRSHVPKGNLQSSRGNFQTYFTIHVEDYAIIVSQNALQVGLLLGISSLFYDGVCKHWPHQLGLGDPWVSLSMQKQYPF